MAKKKTTKTTGKKRGRPPKVKSQAELTIEEWLHEIDGHGRTADSNEFYTTKELATLWGIPQSSVISSLQIYQARLVNKVATRKEIVDTSRIYLPSSPRHAMLVGH